MPDARAGGNSFRRRAHRVAGLHRRAAPGRSGSNAHRGRHIVEDPKVIEPLVPVDLVVDRSVQVDFFGSPDALRLNLEIEFQRNR